MKKQLSFLMTAVVFLVCCSNLLKAQNSPQNVSYSDKWVATDGLGRTLPTYAEVGGVKANKYVGTILIYML